MQNFIENKRASGFLAHITSLPSQYGIGDIGYSSYKFVDFLRKANQSYWQFLPTGVTNDMFGNSPYMCNSAFAGSYLLLSPELLVEHGYLDNNDIIPPEQISNYAVNFKSVAKFKRELVQKSFSKITEDQQKELDRFIETTPWLLQYSIFMSLKEIHGDQAWMQWPSKFAKRDKEALLDFEEEHHNLIGYYCFEQFLFFNQWNLLHLYANQAKIKLFGDIPIYVALDSADVWSHQSIFSINPTTLQPEDVSGVPPDYFSKTGQRWGNPLYMWDSQDSEVHRLLLKWWTLRFRTMFELVDTVRIDHFRAFESYWAIPAANETAEKGAWKNGPGKPFFEVIFNRLGPLEIVAEDLGIITDGVRKLRDSLQFPGMKVLQFAFDGDTSNSFLPHNYTTSNSIVYTGTHDNDTTLGWFLSDINDENSRKTVKNYCNKKLFDDSEIHHDLIHLAMSSIAGLSIYPLQDVFGFGNDCRMNTPGEPEGNWTLRCGAEFLTDEFAIWFGEKTSLFGRGR